MTAADFSHWLVEMRIRGLAENDAQAAKALGVHQNTVTTAKRNGADKRTALACAALLRHIAPYTHEGVNDR